MLLRKTNQAINHAVEVHNFRKLTPGKDSAARKSQKEKKKKKPHEPPKNYDLV